MANEQETGLSAQEDAQLQEKIMTDAVEEICGGDADAARIGEALRNAYNDLLWASVDGDSPEKTDILREVVSRAHGNGMSVPHLVELLDKMERADARDREMFAKWDEIENADLNRIEKRLERRRAELRRKEGAALAKSGREN